MASGMIEHRGIVQRVEAGQAWVAMETSGCSSCGQGSSCGIGKMAAGRPATMLCVPVPGDIKAGDLVLTRDVDPATLQPGDIIAFTSTNDENYGQTVTHKIRSLTTTADGEPGFITYGTTTDTDDRDQSVQQHRDQHHGQHTRYDESLDRIDAQHLHRVDLLADGARAEVGGDGGSGGTRDEQRGNQR